MSQQIRLNLNDNTGNTVSQYNIDTAVGTPVHVQAIDGVSYQFTDLSTGIGPDSIVTERVGNDLLLSFDQGTDLVLENYFSQGQGALVGLQADGGLFSYPVATAPEHVLAEEIAATQAFAGGEGIATPLAALAGIGLIAGGAIALSHNSDDNYVPSNNSGSNSNNSGTGNNHTSPQNNSGNNSSNSNNNSNSGSNNNGNNSNNGQNDQSLTPNPGPITPAPTPSVPSPGPSPSPNNNGGFNNGGNSNSGGGSGGGGSGGGSSNTGYKPTATDDKASGSPGEAVTINVAANDYDPQGSETLVLNSVKLIDAGGNKVTKLDVAGEGTWTVGITGHVTFKPLAGFTGNPKPVEYTIEDDSHNISNKATITVTYDASKAPNKEGVVSMTGEVKVGQTLTAEVSDDDGVPDSGIKYQWFSEGVAIKGATAKTYTIQAGDKGKHISVHVDYTDKAGHTESQSSPASNVVTDSGTT
ncbi:MAG: hypothetical protein Q4A74_07245, partial [Cardiobacteriaceae bacterium]|nr:hypothetical protein [Cardiobacteriaceae bacterium]